MLLEDISHEELLRVITQLDQAIYYHQPWYGMRAIKSVFVIA